MWLHRKGRRIIRFSRRDLGVFSSLIACPLVRPRDGRKHCIALPDLLHSHACSGIARTREGESWNHASAGYAATSRKASPAIQTAQVERLTVAGCRSPQVGGGAQILRDKVCAVACGRRQHSVAMATETVAVFHSVDQRGLSIQTPEIGSYEPLESADTRGYSDETDAGDCSRIRVVSAWMSGGSLSRSTDRLLGGGIAANSHRPDRLLLPAPNRRKIAGGARISLNEFGRAA